MSSTIAVRPVHDTDFADWSPLWDGYNAFYGRAGATALAAEITRATWARFLDPSSNVFGLVAETDGRLLGLANCLFHPSTTRIEPTCYLQDLYTDPAARGRGVARALIEAVYERARSAGIHRVYWQTQASNAAARRLYDTLAAHAGFLVYSREV